jgi:general secretion pathway protein F
MRDTEFRFRAIDVNGATVTGTLSAASDAEAARQLARQGLTPFVLKAKAPGLFDARRRRSASKRELELVLQEFTTLLASGVALVVSLSSLAKSGHHPQLTLAFGGMERAVRRGESFGSALAASDLPLPEYFHQLVQAGEATGRLSDSLTAALEQYQYDRRVAGEMQSAFVYPAVLMASGVGAVAIIFLWVVPRFGTLLTQHGDRMPALSRLTIATGVWLSAHAAWVGIASAIATVGMVGVLRQRRVREAMSEQAARLPLLGTWLVEAEVGRWSSTLAALLTGRVELIRALGLAAGSVRLGFLRARLANVTKSVKAGMTLSAALRENRALNPTGYDLVAVGEASGELPKLLSALARLYETTGRDRMKRALQLIEPLAIIVIGVVIGTIVTAIMLAITSVNDIPL